ncbi:response regulator [Leptolyngbya sp. FACHB-36]|uniref:response regulator n=1 Tax=Leptolyngbya sp. FACHB-36 TaxID=2692808 RepID=UPI00168166C1|nr:response regulator [Leptolyngbya sp. FACHB-36]MBD2022791.1 response regulator [Leptolyngbya sp. FACHB-36]
MQPEQQQRIMGYFIEEAKDHLTTIEQGLLNLQSTLDDPEMVNELFRAAHSVKGGAAMLGLNSIQRVAHRLEDFFKILKESSVRVDQKLESLFLRVFDALQELVAQLQTPFGLTSEAAQTTLTEVEPTFEELDQHLTTLANRAAVGASTVPVSKARPTVAVSSPSLPVDSALLLMFRSDVPARLRDMLQLFRQPETPATREQLQSICQTLSSLGEQLDLSQWCLLVETARQAIAHSENAYRTLAPVVIKDIKQAQELVLAGREPEVLPCEQLRELLPLVAAEPEDDFADFLELNGVSSFSDANLAAASDLPFDALDLSPASDLSLDESFAAAIAEEDLLSQTGPEVGMAELNTLADLFEGEVPDLRSTWQQEEVLSEAAAVHERVPDPTPVNDFSDLLFDDETSPSEIQHSSDDLSDLFSDDLLGMDDVTGPGASPALPTVEANNELDDFFALPDTAIEDTTDLDDFFGLPDEARNSLSEPIEPPVSDLSDAFELPSATPDANSSLNNLDDWFGGMDDQDLTLSQAQENSTEPLTLDLSDLDAALGDATDPFDLSTALSVESSIAADPWDEFDAALPSTEPLPTTDLLDTDDAWEPFSDRTVETPANETSIAELDLFADEDAPFVEELEELSATEETDFSSLLESMPSSSDDIQDLTLEELTDDALDQSWLSGLSEPSNSDLLFDPLPTSPEPTAEIAAPAAELDDLWDELGDSTTDSLAFLNLDADPEALTDRSDRSAPAQSGIDSNATVIDDDLIDGFDFALDDLTAENASLPPTASTDASDLSLGDDLGGDLDLILEDGSLNYLGTDLGTDDLNGVAESNLAIDELSNTTSVNNIDRSNDLDFTTALTADGPDEFDLDLDNLLDSETESIPTSTANDDLELVFDTPAVGDTDELDLDLDGFLSSEADSETTPASANELDLAFDTPAVGDTDELNLDLDSLLDSETEVETTPATNDDLLLTFDDADTLAVDTVDISDELDLAFDVPAVDGADELNLDLDSLLDSETEVETTPATNDDLLLTFDDAGTPALETSDELDLDLDGFLSTEADSETTPASANELDLAFDVPAVDGADELNLDLDSLLDSETEVEVTPATSDDLLLTFDDAGTPVVDISDELDLDLDGFLGSEADSETTPASADELDLAFDVPAVDDADELDLDLDNLLDSEAQVEITPTADDDLELVFDTPAVDGADELDLDLDSLLDSETEVEATPATSDDLLLTFDDADTPVVDISDELNLDLDGFLSSEANSETAPASANELDLAFDTPAVGDAYELDLDLDNLLDSETEVETTPATSDDLLLTFDDADTPAANPLSFDQWLEASEEESADAVPLGSLTADQPVSDSEDLIFDEAGESDLDADLLDLLDLETSTDAADEPVAETIDFDDDLFGTNGLDDLNAASRNASLGFDEDLLDFEEIGTAEAPTSASGLDEDDMLGLSDLDAAEFLTGSATSDFLFNLDDRAKPSGRSPGAIDASSADDLDRLLEDSSTESAASDFELNFGTDDLNGSGSDELTDLDALLAGEPTSADFDNLDDFLSQEPTSESDSLADFDSLLEETSPAFSGELPSLSTDPSNEFAGLEDLLSQDADASNDFADLDNLLNDNAVGGLVVGGAALGGAMLGSDAAPVASNDVDDFSDLETLLEGGPAEANSPAAETIDPPATEFDELDDLLKDAEEKMGGSPTVKSSRGIVSQNRRQVRPGRVFSEQTMRVPVKHLDNLSNLVGELVVNRNSLEQDQERLRQSLDNLLYQVQQLGDVGQRMQDLYERSLLESSLLASRQGYRASTNQSALRTEGGTQTASPEVEYDPLEMDRFTGFHSLSQEMIELIVRVRESASDIEFVVDETDQVTRMFRQVTTQLQEGLTRSRMVPFAQTADRLPRAVRDISMRVGKQAELVVEGRETLIDKMILEQLYDPMTHLVNNAITHGVESPAVRQSAGKAAAGRITIRAFHQGNQTIISVSDDGAGIDVERVKAKAIERGLVAPAMAQSMSRLDVYDLLFHPGFSTVDEVDDFRGRGVGMDVVRTSLSEIRGVITTDSAPGKGTTFTIRLPLTLSISKALCCISDRARIAFPMDGVEDMLDVPKERIQTNAEGQPCIAWRDSLLPLRPLTELLGYNRHLSRGNVYGGNQEDDITSIVVLRSAGNFLALQVDQVLGEQEIVIKQLEGPVPKPVGVAGATVLGDGRIMPIADVLELIDLSMGRLRKDAGGSLWEQGATPVLTEPVIAKTEPTVLIVDDSITVRELLSMTFNKVGYRVEQARDGQEAWEKLRAGLPCDIVFCDIEMPRMDGLELLSRIQKDPNLSQLPIAMLTSRGADRHRQMASSLGASGYFTKPYLEEALLDAAQRMLKGEKLLG